MSGDSLVICTTCNEQIARSAASCPKCGSARSLRDRLTASQLRMVYYLLAIIFSMAIHPVVFLLVVFGGGFYLFRNKFSARPKLVRNIGIGISAFWCLLLLRELWRRLAKMMAQKIMKRREKHRPALYHKNSLTCVFRQWVRVGRIAGVKKSPKVFVS